MVPAEVSGVPMAMRDLTAARRGTEAWLATLLVARWEDHQVTFVRIGVSSMRLAGLAALLADQETRQRRADDTEVDQEVSVSGHWSSTGHACWRPPTYADRARKAPV
jgi:hypothetical protein